MAQRISQLDTIRGVATLGILIMNSVSFGLGGIAVYQLSAAGSYTTLDWCFGIFGEVFADQKFMGLFSLLFGASLILFLDRTRDRTQSPIRLSLWRNIILLGFGAIHGTFWEGDVLMVYGFCAPILLIFRKAKAKTLMWTGISVFGFSILCLCLVSASINSLDTSVSLAEQAFSEIWLEYILFDAFARALGMMLIGMSLYRSHWLTEPLSVSHLRLSCWVLAIGASLSLLGVYWTSLHNFAIHAVFMGNLPNLLATIPMTIAYAALLKWWDENGYGRWLIGKVQALGRMALTNYLSQSAFGIGLVSIVPTDLISRSTLWLAILSIWVFQLWISEWWLNRFKMGPVERLWRAITYRSWS